MRELTTWQEWFDADELKGADELFSNDPQEDPV